MAERINARIKEAKAQGAEFSVELRNEALEEAFYETADEARVLRLDLIEAFDSGARERSMERYNRARRIERTISARWRPGFRELENMLAVTDELLHEVGEVVFDWYYADESLMAERLLDTDAVGGKGLKCFLFLAMLSRVCAIAAEILLLARHGYSDGMRSRMRSLHETSVIMGALEEAEPPMATEVAERYSAWSIVEDKKDLAGDSVDDVDLQAMEESARRRWGADFFKPYGWALPLFPGRRGGVTFAEIDSLVGMSELRSWYRHANHSVHAGPSSVMRRLDFDKMPDPFISGAEDVPAGELAAVMHNTTIMVTRCGVAALRILSVVTESYDAAFLMHALQIAAKSAQREFDKLRELSNGE
ncbi:DUF5677 domain-containing protein [Streptomyces sp. NEAU-YJ-81]|uniref:DUF5677 domain-containing protein n=1 Tax=Streptomyces sp. NEAU-YJ-81 TaxID=2820288 RepID=UPI001ABC9425|nr:DUF5677 domain-containing protein [Streptomyces sp. NEAU-YJ-81]MBO3673930.1 hypothetical protein [Streptomyces sp. NEAU-YJ-81]